MSYPRDFDPEEPPREVRALVPYEPTGTRGPKTTLTAAMIATIARLLGSGATRRDAAALAGTTDDCLRQWLSRGRDAVARKKVSLYTHLLTEVECAEAHYRTQLVAKSHDCIDDRHMNDKVIRWRLAVSAPKDFTIPRDGPVAGGSGALGPAFEMVTPEQAMLSLEEKLSRFLADEAKRSEAEAGPPKADG